MSTNYKATVSDVLDIVSDKRGEASTNTGAMRIRAVSRSVRDFALRRFWRLFLLMDQSVTGDGTNTSYTVGSSSYPMREKGLSEVFVGGFTEDKRYQVVDYTEFKNTVNQNASARVAIQWFDAINDVWKVKLSQTPSNGTLIYYSYYWEPPELTATSDVVVCHDLRIPAYLALAEIYESEEEDQKVLDALNKAEVLVGTVEGIEEAPAVNQSYRMGSQINQPQQKGLGTY